MTTPFEVQDQGSLVTYMVSTLIDRFGVDAARIADTQRLLSAGDIAETWEDIRTHITGLLPEIAFATPALIAAEGRPIPELFPYIYRCST